MCMQADTLVVQIKEPLQKKYTERINDDTVT